MNKSSVSFVYLTLTMALSCFVLHPSLHLLKLLLFPVVSHVWSSLSPVGSPAYRQVFPHLPSQHPQCLRHFLFLFSLFGHSPLSLSLSIAMWTTCTTTGQNDNKWPLSASSPQRRLGPCLVGHRASRVGLASQVLSRLYFPLPHNFPLSLSLHCLFHLVR